MHVTYGSPRHRLYDGTFYPAFVGISLGNSEYHSTKGARRLSASAPTTFIITLWLVGVFGTLPLKVLSTINSHHSGVNLRPLSQRRLLFQ